MNTPKIIDVRGQLPFGLSVKLLGGYGGGDQSDVFWDIAFHGYASLVEWGAGNRFEQLLPTDEGGIGLIVGDWTELAVPLDHVRGWQMG